MQGKLIYNEDLQRLDILDGDGNEFGGLRCGNTVEVLIGCNWIPARVEYSDDWYLYPLFEPGRIPHGLQIRN